MLAGGWPAVAPCCAVYCEACALSRAVLPCPVSLADEYLSGAKKFPIPAYVVSGSDASAADAAAVYSGTSPASSDSAGVPLCHNVQYLGRHGIQTISGVVVAWMSGTFDGGRFSGTVADAGPGHYTNDDVQALVSATKAPEFRGVDMFLTSEWPQKYVAMAVQAWACGACGACAIDGAGRQLLGRI